MAVVLEPMEAAMARYGGVVKGWPELDFSGDWQAGIKAQDKALAAIEAEYPVVVFPVADNYARYAVVSMKPLTLQLIPYLDAYQIPASHLRGLRLADVKQMIEHSKAMAKLFGGRS